MMQNYRTLFDIYLKMLKEDYDDNNPYDNLDELCKKCNRLMWELSGMLSLLAHTGEINYDTEKAEREKLVKTFSTISLFNAYVEDGEVMVFSKI